MCTHEIGQTIPVKVEDVLRWPTMGGTYLEVSTVDAFEIGLKTEMALIGARELELYRGSRGAERTD